MSERDTVKRGDIYYADLSPVVGSEQGGVRPVLIVQNDVGNRYSPTVIAAAITSQTEKSKLPTHIELDSKTVVCPRILSSCSNRFAPSTSADCGKRWAPWMQAPCRRSTRPFPSASVWGKAVPRNLSCFAAETQKSLRQSICRRLFQDIHHSRSIAVGGNPTIFSRGAPAVFSASPDADSSCEPDAPARKPPEPRPPRLLQSQRCGFRFR